MPQPTAIANCGHEVPVTIDPESGDALYIPYACDDCEREADEAAQCYQDEGEANGYPFGTIGAETR